MSDKLNPIEKAMVAYMDGSIELLEKVNKKYDIDLFEMANSLDEKNKKIQKEHPLLNVGKHIRYAFS